MLVRWYLAYSLSFRDIEELALERALKVDHSTINRGVVDNWKSHFAKDNKNYLHAKFFNDTETLDKYKKQIIESLVVEPYEKKPKLANARKAISDYKKASSSINGLLELIMTYLDCGAFMASKNTK